MSPLVIPVGELARFEGEELGRSNWHLVTQEDINAFAQVTHDTYWIHTDPERARKESPWGTTVAHGLYTLSLAAHFLRQVFTVEGAKLVVNYGLNRVRFAAPCPVGSRIRGRATLTKVEEVPGGVQCTVTLTIEREGQVKPVCVAEEVLRYVL